LPEGKDAGPLTLEVMSKPDQYDSTMNRRPLNYTFQQLIKLIQLKNTGFAYFRQMINHPSLDKEIATRMQ
jgi:hypothetical protein